MASSRLRSVLTLAALGLTSAPFAALADGAGNAGAQPPAPIPAAPAAPPAVTTPLPEDLDGSVGKVRGVVAGLGDLLPSGNDGAPEGPFQAVGTVLAGLGAGAIVAASLAWTVAGASALGLERDCPDHKCVEGTTGARTYRRVRDGARAADILVGVGMPVLTGGLLLVVLGSTSAPPATAGASTTPDTVATAGTVRVTPSVGPSGGELVVEASF